MINMKEKFGYFIKDSFNCFGGRLCLSVKNLDGSGLEWNYFATRNADHWYLDKNRAIIEIQKMQELNAIACIEGLSWELVYADQRDFPRIKNNACLIISQDIPSGFKGKHKKAAREIEKKYRAIFKGIAAAWREGLAI